MENLYQKLKENRWKMATTTIGERKAKLKRLKESIVNRRDEIQEALYLDFKKPASEAELTEIHTSLDEINFALRNLRSWIRPKKVGTPITLFGAKSYVYPEAKGVVLIMAPWNYPFYLVISPLISAISAGCVCLLRPSEKAPHTSLIIQKIVSEVFSESEVAVALGDIEVSKQVLELEFDHIFFTGSTTVGKIVMEKAAKHLTSLTLELGGKSPVIIDSEVDLEDAATKIVWGKFLNAGQTCVAPDYIFVPKKLKENFLKLVAEKIKCNYGETINDRKNSPNFARIIDERNFDRLEKYIVGENTLLPDLPSREDSFFMPPTVLTHTSFESKSMEEEIFGPVLPIIEYENLDQVLKHINSKGKPLALYIFSKNKRNTKRLLRETSSGGAVVNNVILHLGNPKLPFGGIGPSGMGGSHGHYGFKAFSHEKAVLMQGPISLIPFYYPPYDTWLSKISYKLLRYLE